VVEVKKVIALRLARPCTVAWDQLVETDGVRYCERCESRVHDLDSLTPGELVALARANPSGFCGKSSTPAGELTVLEQPQVAGGVRARAGGTAVALLASTLAACSGDAGPGGGARTASSNRPVASPSSSPTPCSAVKPSAQPGAVASASPTQLTREDCERWAALGGYITVDCSSLPKAEQR